MKHDKVGPKPGIPPRREWRQAHRREPLVRNRVWRKKWLAVASISTLGKRQILETNRYRKARQRF